jgi:L-glutamine:2-deoxy-scyllo-inosose/3-amino-2,3-dideoxy-scyllo-inosose aminotransferase
MKISKDGKSVLAVSGGKPAVTRSCPKWPITGELEAAWMEAVVRSGRWSWIGPHETAFCGEYAGFIGSKYCLCMANGTVTLQCALQAVGVEPGDEVIVPGLTWVATMQAALDVGANVVLVDIDPETLCIDPAAVEKAVTAKTKAIVPVHLYGCMCDMDAIMAIAAKHNLKVGEDVAHQHGSRWRNQGAGAIGDVGSFSFQQGKVLTSGEGGAVTCNDESYYKVMHALKQVGWGPDLQPGNHYGHNYRITEMQAVLLRGGLSRLNEQNRIREENADYIAAALKKEGGPLRVARKDPRITRQAYYALTLVYDPKKAEDTSRQAYINALSAERCLAGGTYAPVYANPLMNLYDKTSPVPFRDQKKIQDYRSLKLPNVEKAVNMTAVVLPHAHLLGERAYIDELISAVRKVNDNLKSVRQAWEESEAQAKKK